MKESDYLAIVAIVSMIFFVIGAMMGSYGHTHNSLDNLFLGSVFISAGFSGFTLCIIKSKEKK